MGFLDKIKHWFNNTKGEVWEGTNIMTEALDPANEEVRRTGVGSDVYIKRRGEKRGHLYDYKSGRSTPKTPRQRKTRGLKVVRPADLSDPDDVDNLIWGTRMRSKRSSSYDDIIFGGGSASDDVIFGSSTDDFIFGSRRRRKNDNEFSIF